jgi:phosphatidylglycerophosphatase A
VTAAPGRLVTLIATVFHVGRLPGAPGTYGTLCAVPVALLLLHLGRPFVLGGAVGVTLLGTWAAERYCAATGRPDDQQVVIDEVAGYLVTLALAPPGRLPILLGLSVLLFRLLDIVKPWPIRLIDRDIHGGFGVMADDLCAGLLAAALLWVLAAVVPGLFVWRWS